MAYSRTMQERFDNYVKKTDTCWEWTGSISPEGYGRTNINKKPMYTHRVFYEMLVGPIPPGMTIDHLCRNRKCLNPAHLEVVTQKVNSLRGFSPPSANAKKTHCSRDHALTGDNLYARPRGKRMCKTCNEYCRLMRLGRTGEAEQLI